MAKQNLNRRIHDARVIVEQLHSLLHEDAMHRLDLYQEYSHDRNATKWSPDLYQRCQLIEVLREKLNVPTY